MSSDDQKCSYLPHLKVKFKDEISPKLTEEFSYSCQMMLPTLEKIVVNACYSPAVADKKKLDILQKEMSLICGQHAVKTRARKSIAGFHLRENDEIGCKVTLRKNNMYDFLDKLINIALPRIKDFSPYSGKSFDKFFNFNFGITEQIVFPEIDYDKLSFTWGMNITLCIKAKSQQEAFSLLKHFNFPVVA